jgi:hypothetical protein
VQRASELDDATMKKITHTDTCSPNNIVGEARLSVTFRGTHTGSFMVERNGLPLPANADRTVTLGDAAALRGATVLVLTNVNQIGPTKFFEVDYVLEGAVCGPFTVQDTFDDGDPNADVREQIRFV